jgi:hypothetical protein
MPATVQTAIAVIGIEIGKNTFHIVGLDGLGSFEARSAPRSYPTTLGSSKADPP